MTATKRRVIARARTLAVLAIGLGLSAVAGVQGSASVMRPAVAVGPGAGPPAARSAATSGCPPKHSRVLRRLGRVVVYHSPPLGRGHLRHARACRAGGGNLLLAANSVYDGFGGPRAVAARGDAIAFVTVTRDDGLDGDVAVLDVVARDLVTGRRLLSARSNGTRYVVRDGLGYSAQGVPAIVIAADGSVAWIACDQGGSSDRNEHYDVCGGGPRSVWVSPPGTDLATPASGAPRELARGSQIASRSLRLDATGTTLTWRQDGQPRSAPVSVGDASPAAPAL